MPKRIAPSAAERVEGGARRVGRLVASALLVVAHGAFACGCFPPELRAKAGEDALQLARVAVYGRIVDVGATGRARVLVLESFKGPAVGATVELAPDAARCGEAVSTVGEETLVLSFGEAVTACDKHPPEHFLLEVFRAGATK